MTVKELCEKLAQMPQDSLACFYSEDGSCWQLIAGVEEHQLSIYEDGRVGNEEVGDLVCLV
jgi:hypothetical protein